MAMLLDREWTLLEAALDRVRSREGQGFQEERRTIEAVVWRMRTGAPWRALPAEFGPWWRTAQLHIRGSNKGTWARLLEVLREQGRPDLGEVFLDGSSMRAHQKAAGAKGGPG